MIPLLYIARVFHSLYDARVGDVLGSLLRELTGPELDQLVYVVSTCVEFRYLSVFHPKNVQDREVGREVWVLDAASVVDFAGTR